MSETNLSTLSYNGVIYPVAELPAISQHFLMSRGLTHVLGNEIASKVTNWKKAETKEVEGKLVGPTEEAITAKIAELTAERVASLRSGELSLRESGPRGPKDPVADKAWQLAYDVVVGRAETENRFGPSAPKERRISKADLEIMATNYLEKVKEDLMAKARKELEAARRNAAKVEFSLDALMSKSA